MGSRIDIDRQKPQQSTIIIENSPPLNFASHFEVLTRLDVGRLATQLDPPNPRPPDSLLTPRHYALIDSDIAQPVRGMLHSTHIY